MSIKLREGESVGAQARSDRSSFLFAKGWGIIGLLALVWTLFRFFDGRTNDTKSVGLIVVIAVVFFLPLLYKWIQNQSKQFVVTNQRVYVEVGMLSKSKSDIPLDKINDVRLEQSLFQRLVGTGDIHILTGNDMPVVMKDIDNPDDFKNVLSGMMIQRPAPRQLY